MWLGDEWSLQATQPKPCIGCSVLKLHQASATIPGSRAEQEMPKLPWKAQTDVTVASDSGHQWLSVEARCVSQWQKEFEKYLCKTQHMLRIMIEKQELTYKFSEASSTSRTLIPHTHTVIAQILEQIFVAVWLDLIFPQMSPSSPVAWLPSCGVNFVTVMLLLLLRFWHSVHQLYGSGVVPPGCANLRPSSPLSGGDLVMPASSSWTQFALSKDHFLFFSFWPM